VKAVVLNEFGSPDQLTLIETTDPRPGPGDCLIATEACDVLFLDTMLRSGAAPEGMEPELPWIPGTGVAGQVVAVGPDVEPTWQGARVIAQTGRAHAELVRAPLAGMVPIPEDISADVAAAVLHDGQTAIALFDRLPVGADDAVLLVGASGGLGLLCVQLARSRARRVVAVARDARKLERIRALQPDAVIDSEAGDWVAAARDALGGAADVVLDNVGGKFGAAAASLLAENGRFSAHGTPSGTFAQIETDLPGARVTGIDLVQLDPDARRRYTGAALAAILGGELAPIIGQTFPLKRAAAAHAAIEARTVFGKTLLTIARQANAVSAIIGVLGQAR
jgi:NADPH:quinone reductase